MESDWKLREVYRFLLGKYKKVPWANENWWIREKCPPDIHFHFTHVSRDDPSKIAYTPSERHGIEDRQVRMKPGKYLNKYFSSILSNEEIANWAGRFAGENETNFLKFARTADEIERVYVDGPNSCMSDKSFESSIHPARVYAAGDLAVAYIERGGEITGRAVCWPEKKIHSTIYGDDNRLKSALESAGYEKDSLCGAKLLLIEEDHCIVCPYLDNGEQVEISGNYLIIGDGISAQSTTGLVGTNYCDCCEEYCSDTTLVGNENWCESCMDNAFYCDCCDNWYPCEDSIRINGRRYEEYWCSDCAENNAFKCDHCEEYFADSGIEVENETWCEKCVENDAFYCDHCEAYYSQYHSEMIEVENEIWCKYCADNCAFQCEKCQEWFGKEIKRITEDGEDLCRYCYEAREKEELKDE